MTKDGKSYQDIVVDIETNNVTNDIEKGNDTEKETINGAKDTEPEITNGSKDIEKETINGALPGASATTKGLSDLSDGNTLNKEESVSDQNEGEAMYINNGTKATPKGADVNIIDDDDSEDD